MLGKITQTPTPMTGKCMLGSSKNIFTINITDSINTLKSIGRTFPILNMKILTKQIQQH